jgi:AraC-like DNA-binding protein
MDKSVLPAQKSIYREFPVPDRLKDIAVKLWSFRATSTGNGKVVFSLLPDFTSSILYVRDYSSKNSRLQAYGPSLKRTNFEYEMMAEAVGIRLRPEVILITLNSGNSVPLNAVKTLSDRKHLKVLKDLKNSRSSKAALKILEDYVIRNTDPNAVHNKPVTFVLDAIQETHGNCRLEDIYEKLEIGKRQIQRMFRKHCQMSPKEFLKIVRIHSATRELVKSGYDHFGVIEGLGYYDQSHYYREFRALLGLNPTAFELRQKALKHEKLVE